MVNIRISNYVIYVNINNNTEVLLIHGYTGAYCTVSIDEATFLKSMKNVNDHNHESGNLFSAKLLDKLKVDGFLTDLTEYEEEALFSKIVNNIHKKKMQKQLSYVVIPSYDCNFNCSYCFQKKMRTVNAVSYLKKRISKDSVDNIFKAMDQLEKLHNIKNTEKKRNISFYGGEPLLAKNKEIVEYIIKKSFEICKPVFSAISNGSELEHYEQMLSPKMLNNIQITLDGIFDINNQRRLHNDLESKNTFNKIVKNIQLALDKEVNINIRINIDKRNIEKLSDLAEYIVKQKWNTYKNFHVTIAPVYNYNDSLNQSEYFTSGELSNQLSIMRQNLQSLCKFKMQEEQYFEKFDEIFSHNKLLTPLFKYNFCSAPTSMYAFDAHNNVYTCLEKVGKVEQAIGNIDKNGYLEINNERLASWNSRTVISNTVCKKCSYALFCGGGCANKAEELNGTMFSNHCDDFKTLFNNNVAQVFLQKNQKVEIKGKVSV